MANRAHLDVGGRARGDGATLQVEAVEEPLEHDLWRLAEDFDRSLKPRNAGSFSVSQKPLDMLVHVQAKPI